MSITIRDDQEDVITMLVTARWCCFANDAGQTEHESHAFWSRCDSSLRASHFEDWSRCQVRRATDGSDGYDK